VARLFHRLLGVTFLLAWISLGVQVHVLIGRQGLLPIADHLARSRQTFFEFPTHLWLDASDLSITAGIVAGALLAIVAVWGKLPRICLGLSTALYLSYATACRDFLNFQWDSLLIECGFLATLLPGHRPARLSHVLLRLLLFKVYFESGVSKLSSRIGDWADGSAMALYYETSPLPTPLAYFAHALPLWWHQLESRLVLGLELVIPWLVFGTRRLRLFALVVMTAFQLAIFATSNYGFLCLLMAALGVFLLDDRDLDRFYAWVRRKVGRGAATQPPRTAVATIPWRIAVTAVATAWVWISVADGMSYFDRSPANYWEAVVRPLRPYYAPWGVANTYHMFAQVTRDRIEPELQTFDGQEWTAHHLRYKPGDPGRAPPWVAPHQPRVDFRLWFHGLGYQRRQAPQYVRTLEERVCTAPGAVAGLFEGPLPAAPTAVRLVYWRYRFTNPEERSRDGTWWSRQWVRETVKRPCSDSPPDP